MFALRFACMMAILGAALIASQLVGAEQNQPKSSPPAANRPVIAPPKLAEAQPGWNVTCQNSTSGLTCSAVQMIFLKQTGQRLMTVGVKLSRDTRKPVVQLLLPLGIYLPAGVTVQFGENPARILTIVSCEQTGCSAEHEIPDAEVASLLKGEDLKVSVQNLERKPITVSVPALGFSTAYAKVK